MKANIFPLWWNPWGEDGVCFDDLNVSISVDNLNYDKSSDYKILFLAEPCAILPDLNKSALENCNHFDKIYTFNQSIIDKYETAELFEWGSSWLDFIDLEINKKNHITFVTSNKNQSPGHELRLEIFEKLNKIDFVNGLEVYQHKSPPFHHRRNDFFETSKFHISVENSQQQNYFTEKIIDCFASKTIPIYYGCPNIGNWFNLDGIIYFNDLSELENIFDFIDENYYNDRQSVIEENYEIAKKFHSDNDVVPRLTKKINQDVKENAFKRI